MNKENNIYCFPKLMEKAIGHGIDALTNEELLIGIIRTVNPVSRSKSSLLRLPVKVFSNAHKQYVKEYMRRCQNK